VHVRDLGETSLEIDTPNVAVTIAEQATIGTGNEAGDTTVVKVSNGDAQVSAAGKTVALHTNRLMRSPGTISDCGGNFVGAPDRIGFMVSGTGIVGSEAQAAGTDERVRIPM